MPSPAKSVGLSTAESPSKRREARGELIAAYGSPGQLASIMTTPAQMTRIQAALAPIMTN